MQDSCSKYFIDIVVQPYKIQTKDSLIKNYRKHVHNNKRSQRDRWAVVVPSFCRVSQCRDMLILTLLNTYKQCLKIDMINLQCQPLRGHLDLVQP